MFFKRLLGLFCCLSVCSFVCDAAPDKEKVNTKKTQKQNSSSSTLLFILESALKNNKDILAFQQDLMRINEEHVLKTAPFKPSVEASADYQSGRHDRWSSDAPTAQARAKSADHSSRQTYGVAVKQNIFNGMSDIAALKETDLLIKSKWSDYEALIQKTLNDVATLYFEILAKKQDIGNVETLLDHKKSIIEVTEEMYSTGAAKNLDVANARAEYHETKIRLEKSNADYIRLCAQFEEIVGIKVPATQNFYDKLFDANMSKSQALDIALKNNPSIIAATNKLAAAKEAIKKPNPELTPSVDAYYRFDQYADHGSRSAADKVNPNNSRGHTVGVSITVPIYEKGVNRAAKRQYQNDATKAAIEKEKIIQEVRAGIDTTWAAIAAAQASIISAKSAVESGELAVRDTIEEYKAGLKIVTDVLLAQHNLFEAKTLLVYAEKDYFVGQCNANALLGRMNPKNLKIKGSDFNPSKANYQ